MNMNKNVNFLKSFAPQIYQKNLILATLMLVLSFSSMASHFTGGEITYTHISGDNYVVTLKIYRDCDGISFGNTVSLQSVPGGSFTLNLVSTVDVTLLCPGQTSPCAPGGGSGGIEELTYTGNRNFIPLGGGGTYTISYSSCCRNGDITNSSPAGWYISAILDPNINPRNTSPVFLNPPYVELCVNQPAFISPNAFDADGDALVYSLVDCMRTSTTSVSYNSPFSGTNPFTTAGPEVIDPNTGLVTFTPTTVQVGVMCIKVEEFRGGVKIGEVVRDIQVNVKNCGANIPPVVAPIANQIAPVGVLLCIPVSATDANSDLITLSAITGLIPPGTFVQNTNIAGAATGTFCITPLVAMQGQSFAVTISGQDDNCPIPGVGSTTFNITVPAINCNTGLTAVLTNPSAVGSNDGAIDITPTGFFIPIQYTWTGPGGFTANTQDISALAAGSYTVTVVGGGNCVQTATYLLTTDNVPPIISCPLNITVTSAPGLCGAIVNYSQPSASDNGTPGPPTSLGGYTNVGTFGGSTYFRSNSNLTAENAHLAALALGGHLVTISDAAENAFITGITTSEDIIGLTDRDSHGTYKWVTNEPLTYTNWAGGEPSCLVPVCGGSGQEDWTVTNFLSMPGIWNDYLNFQARRYIVEFDGGPVLTTLTSGPASGGFFPVGSTTVTWTATDAAGNSSSCSFTVTVISEITASLAGDATLCSANLSTTDLIVTIINGTGPFQVVYSDGTSNTTVSNYNSGDPITVGPTSTTNYTLVSVSDATACPAIISGSATVVVLNCIDFPWAGN